jgi:1,4-alpha-glucan branching enzyme
VRRSVHLTSRSDTTELGAIGAVTAVRVDPDHHFLLRRHWGEVARFTLRAPNAKSVELAGNLAPKPIAATREGDLWTVTLPVTEGRYTWMWRVDDKGPTDEEAIAAAKSSNDPSARVGVRIVNPIQRLADSDAK